MLVDDILPSFIIVQAAQYVHFLIFDQLFRVFYIFQVNKIVVDVVVIMFERIIAGIAAKIGQDAI